METPGITPTPPTPPNPYSVGRLEHDRDRRNKQSFEDAFAEEENKPKEDDDSVVEDNTPEDEAQPPLSGSLQDGQGIIRKDDEDGQLHVDIVV